MCRTIIIRKKKHFETQHKQNKYQLITCISPFSALFLVPLGFPNGKKQYNTKLFGQKVFFSKTYRPQKKTDQLITEGQFVLHTWLDLQTYWTVSF